MFFTHIYPSICHYYITKYNSCFFVCKFIRLLFASQPFLGKDTFHPVKGWFARTKLIIAKAQASRTIELGAALVNNVYIALRAYC